MITTLAISEYLGIEKKAVSHILNKKNIQPIEKDGNRKLYDESVINIIEKELRIEKKFEYTIFESKPKELIFESKMNYE